MKILASRLSVRAYLALRLFATGLGIYLVLSGTFCAAHYILHIAPLPGITVSPLFFLALLPHISLYTLPLTVMLALGFTRDHYELCGEQTQIALFRRLTRWSRICTTLFVITCAGFYIWAHLWGAPVFYRSAKQRVITSLVRSIQSLDPGPLHALTRSAVIRFQDKHIRGSAVVLKRIFLAVSRSHKQEKKQISTVIVANQCRVSEYGFIFTNGSLMQEARSKRVTHSFKTLSIPHNKSWITPKIGHDQAKYQSIRPLIMRVFNISSTGGNSSFESELWKRVIQIVWFFFLPFLFLITLPDRRRGRGSLRGRSLIAAAGLFFLFYMLSTLCAGLIAGLSGALKLSFGLVLLCAPPLFLVYWNNKQRKIDTT